MQDRLLQTDLLHLMLRLASYLAGISHKLLSKVMVLCWLYTSTWLASFLPNRQLVTVAWRPPGGQWLSIAARVPS